MRNDRMTNGLRWLLAGALALPTLAFAAEHSCRDGSGGCPVRIADGTGAVAIGSVTLAPDACYGRPISVLEVHAHVRHANIGDLNLVLENPHGVQFPLLTRARETAGAAVGSCAGDDIDVAFRVDGAVTQACAATIPAIGRTLRAEATSLGAPDGALEAGVWQLHVQDMAHGGDGELVSWSLVLGCFFKDGFEG